MADRIKKVSISSAWGETIRFVAREAGLLGPVAIFLLALPSILLGIVTPDMTTTAEPGSAFWVLFPLLTIVTIAGCVTIAALALKDGISVGEALRRTMRRLVPLLILLLVLFFLTMILAIPIAAIAAGGETDPMRAVAGLANALMIALPFIMYLSARLSMIVPVAANEEEGVVGILKRSFTLTRGTGWKLAVAYFILVVTYFILLRVIVYVIAILLTLAGTAPQAGNLSGFALQFIAGVVTGVCTLYMQVFLARIYVQLEANQSSGS